jgi:hypothetical protein
MSLSTSAKTTTAGQRASARRRTVSPLASSGPRPERPTNRASPDGTPTAPPTATEDDDRFEEYVNNFEDANKKGHVLNTQTYGGQIIKDNGKDPAVCSALSATVSILNTLKSFSALHDCVR